MASGDHDDAPSDVGTVAESDVSPHTDVIGGDTPGDVVAPDPTTPDCAGLADGAACDDGDPCTVGERCHEGECAGGQALGTVRTVTPADDWPDTGSQGVWMQPRRIAMVGNELRFVISSVENYGETALVAADMEGHPLWAQWEHAANYSMRGLATTSDGATYFANSWLTRYSADGAVDWNRTPPNLLPDPTCPPLPPQPPYGSAEYAPYRPDPTQVAGMPDGGVVTAGIATGDAVPCCLNPAYLAFATRYDAAGSELWTWRGCPTTGGLEVLQEFIRLDNGDFLLLGERQPQSAANVTWLVRLSSTGQLLWRRELAAMGCLHLAELDDHGIAVGCRGYEVHGPGLVHRLDANGDVQWSEVLPYAPLNFILSGLFRGSDGVIVARSSTNGVTMRIGEAGEIVGVSTPGAVQHIPSYDGYNAEVHVPGIGYIGAVHPPWDESIPNGPLKLQFYVADEFGHLTCEQSGVCAALTPVPDGQSCTYDNCDPSLGLSYPQAVDGLSCDQSGVCQAGVCTTAP